MDDLDRGMKLEDGTWNKQRKDAWNGVLQNSWTAMGDCYVGVNLQPAFGRHDASDRCRVMFFCLDKNCGLVGTVRDRKQ